MVVAAAPIVNHVSISDSFALLKTLRITVAVHIPILWVAVLFSSTPTIIFLKDFFSKKAPGLNRVAF